MEEKGVDKIVYSLWAEPSGDLLKNARNWNAPQDQLNCLSLSVKKSSEHFSEVELITDTEGWGVIKKLNLPFTSVKTILDKIPKYQHEFWALGKIYAYKEQDKPFIHLDNDAILWKGLPDFAKNAGVFVQHEEPGNDPNWGHVYQESIDYTLKVMNYLPPKWGEVKTAYNTGIFGGIDIDFIQEYCYESLKFVNDELNEYGWSTITNKGMYCVLFEQYLLACMIEHRNKEVVFFDRFLNDEVLTGYGFTHLWGSKKDPRISGILENSIKNHYPEGFDKVKSLF